jgi:hypothetical protein
LKNLFDLYQQAVDFNHKAGNKLHEFDTLDFWRALENQSKLMVEESKEGLEASQYNDKIESIDALADEFFVWAWKARILEQSGFDVEGAIQAVIDNNSKKVFNSFYESVEAKEKLEEHYDEEFFIETSVYNGVPFYTIRDQNNKIRKPVDFVPVNLEEFLP